MATVLSRALKLPVDDQWFSAGQLFLLQIIVDITVDVADITVDVSNISILSVQGVGKKSPDLGEYDPLTQADSDESEDDLVLNIQKNGGVKNGKSPPEEIQDPDSDVEVGMTKQHTSENTPEGYPAETAGSLEQKAAPSLMPYLRTAIFLLTVVISMILVLVCAFLIPCPPRDLHNTWNRNLGQGAGGVLSPLELCDVNGDGLPDILIVFTALMNASVMGVSRPSVTVVALSGMNGSTLWSIQLPEETRSVHCNGLSLGAAAEPVCLVTGISKFLSLLSASTGKTIWTLNSIHLSSGILAAPAATLPDVDGDGIRDIVVLALKETQPDVFFILVSGKTGTALGGPVKYSTNGEGKVIGPQVHITSRGAIYILFGFGNVQAVALKDIFTQARNRDSFPAMLQQEEPEWEKRRSVNLSELIDIYSQPIPGYFGADQIVDFMLQAQTGDGNKKQPGPRPERPGLHHLYLLHPVFPTVLLDLTNATDKVIASAVGINDLQKDAFHITVTTTATSEKQPGFLSVSKLGLKWAMMSQGRMVWLKDATTPKISRGEVRRFLARLKFVDFPQKL
ncbi:protein FAM234B [Willisornis vidua]|uniref:Protein FAM234B n=1 Tax=Willisornis vidua TaxID=1566151 RepID=A0ABQ9D6R3_9PASS|nr:protein FAM234B [Willisornis vidua]